MCTKAKQNTQICFSAAVYINIMQDTSWQRDLPTFSGYSPKKKKIHDFEAYALN